MKGEIHYFIAVFITPFSLCCSEWTAKTLNGWTDHTKCSALSEECLSAIGTLAGLDATCLNSIPPSKLRRLPISRSAELLNGSISPAGRYSDYHIEHQLTLLKNLRGELDRLSADYLYTIWTRPSLCLAILNSFSNGYLARLITADAFEYGPVFLAAAITPDLLARLPIGVFRTARPEMMAALPPGTLRSLTPSHIASAHRSALAHLSADQLALLPESCFPAMSFAQVASLVGAATEAATVRLWRAAQHGPAKVALHFVRHVQQHPCQALRARRAILLPAAAPLIHRQCAFVWAVQDRMHMPGSGVEREISRFPLIMCIVMGVVMTALLIHTCIVSINELNG